MKRVIITVVSAILLVCLFPISVSAEEALKAPTVQYKLINQDEIALRWTEVEGADGYCIYRTDTETGKTVKYKNTIKGTTVKVKGLKAETEYIFQVAAVSENDGQIAFGEKSKGTALTTPDEWYYYFPDHMYFDIDDMDCDLMMRKHYDNTGSEVFNMLYINKEVKKKASNIDSYEISIKYRNTSNIDGYVYFPFWYFWSASGDISTYLCRMKNDGSDFEIVTDLPENNFSNLRSENYNIITDPQNSAEYIYVIDNENENSVGSGDYEDVSEYFNNFKAYYIEHPDMITDNWGIYVDIDYCESSIRLNHYDRDNKINEEKYYWCSEEKSVFSRLARDDKYIYFFSEPLYNITDKTDTIVYRAKYDGSDLQEIVTMPKDNSFIYGDPNNGSIQLFGCDGEYLYYYVYGRKVNEENRENYYTFYRININEKDAVSQKITSADSLYGVDVELCNGYLYIETYIYDKNYNAVPIYIRIRADGKGLEKQDEPFEWRY